MSDGAVAGAEGPAPGEVPVSGGGGARAAVGPAPDGVPL